MVYTEMSLGKTEEVIKSCRRQISHQILRDIFVFTSDRMKRYEGSWHMEKRQLFPDCIFVETTDPAAVGTIGTLP